MSGPIGKASARKGKGRPIAELPIPPGTEDPDAYRDSRRLAYRAEVAVNWCPELGTVLANEEVIDGKSERGGYPGRAHAAHPVDAADHGLCRAADRRPRGRRLAAADQGHAAQLGRPQRGGRGRFPDSCSAMPTETIRVYTTRPDTLVRCDLHGSGARASARRPDHERGPASERGRISPGRREQERPRPHRPGQDEDRRVHRRLCDKPGQRPVDPGLDRRLRADGIRHRRDHGRAGPRRARLRVCPDVQPADRPRGRAEHGTGGCSARPCRGRAGRRGQFAERRDRARRPAHGRGQGRDHRLAGETRARQEDRSITSCATGCFRVSGTGASRSRSCSTTTTARRRSPNRSCRFACPSSKTSSRPASPSPP